MSEIAIRLEDVSKCYRLGVIGRTTLGEDLARWWAKARGRPDPFLKIDNDPSATPDGERVWALQGVSFDVGRGEVLGVIGRNGAGKSTLLKVLSRVTAPTLGCIKLKGRVASLLEVGTGFHPELSGRENIFLNGAIFGMSRAEVRDKFDRIVSFAELDPFIDTPVKRYSSGMYVRLAFAVAAHLDPEILLVDEVLAVGDLAFQKKCLGKMDDISREGRTVIFVSHNMGSIQRLCGSAIRMEEGQVAERGDTGDVISGYQQSLQTADAVVQVPDSAHRHRSAFRIERVEVRNAAGVATTTVLQGEDLLVRIGYRCSGSLPALKVGIGIHAAGLRLATVHSEPMVPVGDDRPHGITCRIPGSTLLPNFYSLHLGAHSVETGRGLDWVPDLVTFRVSSAHVPDQEPLEIHDKGLVRLTVSWEHES